MAYTLTCAYTDESYSVIGYTGDPDNLVIPATYNDGIHGAHPVTIIEEFAFESCQSLLNVTIGNNVVSVNTSAFQSCNNLTHITIGNNLTFIGEGAFSDCLSLTDINVSENNTTFKTIDGNLYTKSGGALRQYSIGKSDTFFVVPNGVIVIASRAFSNCSSLTSVTIPDSVTSIGNHAFYRCSSLNKMILFAVTPPTLHNVNAISSATTKIIIPTEGEQLYKNATNWSSWANKIIGDSLYLDFINYTKANKEYIDSKTENDLNLENGSGEKSVQMLQDGTSGTVSFTGKNPHATALDSTITGDIPYGATGNFASVEGSKAVAQGKRSHAEGSTTLAKGNYSHAEGDNSVTLGDDSHAEGYKTVAKGVASHSEGVDTQATGDWSHSAGYNTIASGKASSTEGESTQAQAEASHAGGMGTIAKETAQTVIGKYNADNHDALFIIGNGEGNVEGTSYFRQNAFWVTKGGGVGAGRDAEESNELVRLGQLSTVAKTGSYNDLNDKPTIPPAITIDQTYSATSSNPQSGVAVSQAVTELEEKTEEITDSLSQDLQEAEQDIQELQNDIDIDVNYKSGQNLLSYNGDTVTITERYKNIKSGTTSTRTETVALANGTTAGLMAPSTVTAIQQMRAELDQLEGQSIRLVYTVKDNPTASEIGMFVIASGYVQSQFPTIGVVVKNTNHIWRWYNNTNAWQDIGVDTVNQFTNTVAGVIKGSTTDGQVYAEDDGTGSVNGWSALKNAVNGHIANTSNPHQVTKSQVGLGDVGNFKAVSTVASQGLTDTEKSNARANIGAGTSNFSGNYNDLSNKPTIPSGDSLVSSTDRTTWNGKQAQLVNQTNIKSINGQSLLGSGDLTVSGGYTEGYTVNTPYISYVVPTVNGTGSYSGSMTPAINPISVGDKIQLFVDCKADGYMYLTTIEITSVSGAGSISFKYLTVNKAFSLPSPIVYIGASVPTFSLFSGGTVQVGSRLYIDSFNDFSRNPSGERLALMFRVSGDTNLYYGTLYLSSTTFIQVVSLQAMPSGTQLYKHEISTGMDDFTIYSTRSAVYTSTTTSQTEYYGAIVVSFNGNPECGRIMFDGSGGAKIEGYNGTFTAWEYGASITDTVTKL